MTARPPDEAAVCGSAVTTRWRDRGATATPHATRPSRARGPHHRHTTPQLLPARRSSRIYMEKPPPIVEGQHMQTLHPADQQWVGSHQQQSAVQAVQHHGGSMITDEIRFSIIDAVYLRPGIWDCQREKTVGPSRKELFAEVTTLINQQNQLDPELTPEEVEKQWKNLKDTYVKTRKKLSYNSDSMPVTPKWKFYSSLMFLDDLFSVHRNNIKRRIDDVSGSSQNAIVSAKRIPPPPSEETEDEDEYMAFCRSLLHPLREIAYKDRIQYLKVQKAIRDLLHDAQMDMLLTHMR